jgi:hypothetical protein
MTLEERVAKLEARMNKFLDIADGAGFKNANALIAVVQHQANQYEMMRAELRELKRMLGQKLVDEHVEDEREMMRKALTAAGQSPEAVEALIKQKYG